MPWGGPAPDNQWKERIKWRIIPLLLAKRWQPPKPSRRVIDGERIILNFTYSGPDDLIKKNTHETMDAIFDWIHTPAAT